MPWHWKPGARLMKVPLNWFPFTNPTYSDEPLWFSQDENGGRTCADAVKDVSSKAIKARKIREPHLTICLPPVKEPYLENI
jgi:hypothetical protein